VRPVGDDPHVPHRDGGARVARVPGGAPLGGVPLLPGIPAPVILPDPATLAAGHPIPRMAPPRRGALATVRADRAAALEAAMAARRR
jgi:hypothetical protein